jgi:PAS domain S-box-containing protein
MPIGPQRSAFRERPPPHIPGKTLQPDGTSESVALDSRGAAGFGPRSLWSRIVQALPRGHTLPDGAWERRHRGILILLWLHVVGIPVFGLAEGYGVVHSIGEGGLVALPALLASTSKASRKVRAGLVSLGLLTSSALIVHFSGGYIEAHFHFFVMIVVLTLYEDWFPFLLAVAYVVIHHGLAGAFDPGSVFNHAAGREHPWRWAGIHAFFVASAGAAGVVAWRLNEDVRHQLTAVVNSSNDAIYTTGLDAIIQTWNRGAERTYGYSADDVKGQHVSFLVPTDRRQEISWAIEQVKGGQSIEHWETVRVRKDGQRVDVSLTISPTTDSAGRIIGYSSIARDITERKRAAEELDRAREEADRMKSEFFALVSHDLRTPLASIKGYSELLTDSAATLPDQERHFLEVITRNTNRLERLVDDLLFVAQIEAGTFTVATREVNLSQLVSDCVEGAKPRAQEKDVDLILAAEPHVRLSGDDQRLAQLLDNLISNALKYTPEGGRVEATLQRENGNVRIDVKDSGIGIPAEEQQFLFDRFFRASTAKEAAVPGVGLGLTIVKAITEAHGGRIEVESQEGRGTTFRVELPAVAA